MLDKTMMSAHDEVPAMAIRAVACQKAKYHPVIIYHVRMRSSDNINPHSINCPLASQRLNVPVTVPDGNHDGFY